MLKISVVSPSGIIFEGDARYVVVSGNNGQLGILKNHVPVVVPITRGFVKVEQEETTTYVVIANGVLEQSDNVITVIAQEASLGADYEAASNKLIEMRKTRKAENQKRMMDFVQMEMELKKNIKETSN
ncbi:MAG TPA: ATP synthase F1 subunit epsilon [Bacilli bacterium]|nr:ATP synthase F1 subunit epsilon [Bacilli bacterium]